MTPDRKVPVVKSTGIRDIVISVLVGALVLGFILSGILHMSRASRGEC